MINKGDYVGAKRLLVNTQIKDTDSLYVYRKILLSRMPSLALDSKKKKGKVMFIKIFEQNDVPQDISNLKKLKTVYINRVYVKK